jgi:aspartate kinase
MEAAGGRGYEEGALADLAERIVFHTSRRRRMKVRVLKFGGSSMANADCLQRVAALIAQEVDTREVLPVVVVSAMAGITDLLFEMAGDAASGRPYGRRLAEVRQQHLIAAEESSRASLTHPLLLADLAAAFERLERELEQVAREGEWGLASVAAWGERLCVLLLEATLQSAGVRAAAVREEIIVTEAPERFRASAGANPLCRETGRRVRAALDPLVAQGVVAIVPGFIARSLDGKQTLLGRGGSDWTATLVAAALEQCCEVCIYTDVSGVLSADPRLVWEARRLPRLSYDDAAQLAWFGAKVLHPQTLGPIREREITVSVKNTFDPEAPGTVIGPFSSLGAEMGALALRRHLALVSVAAEEPFGSMGRLSLAPGILAGAGIIPLTWRSGPSGRLAFVIEETQVDASTTLLQERLGGVRVGCKKGLAACTFLGGDMLAELIRPGCALTALAAEQVRVEAASLTERCLILLVKDADAQRTLRELHAALIPAPADMAAYA